MRNKKDESIVTRLYVTGLDDTTCIETAETDGKIVVPVPDRIVRTDGWFELYREGVLIGRVNERFVVSTT